MVEGVSNIIGFTLKKEKEIVDKCSFCKKPIVRGKTIQESNTSPAICFDCVGRCNELLGETNE